MNPRIPVILDTDIGGDIDDTWALALLLQSPELELKLVTTVSGDTTYRAKVAARLLATGGRGDVAIGIGLPSDGLDAPQGHWVADYELNSYPGPLHQDGVGALIDAIMHTHQNITLISIGPATNIAAALAREPRIAQRARFVGMHGSLRRGYGGSQVVVPEYNVKADPEAFRAVLNASWEITITPLDTCGIVQLSGEPYRAVRDCPGRLAQALIKNYRIWAANVPWDWARQFDPEQRSTTLYDTVAVYLAYSEELLKVEQLGLRITDDGYTRIDAQARTVSCATGWKDLAAFEELLVDRLIKYR